jgi:hypothetical protein
VWGERPVRTVKDLGDADRVLSNHAYFKHNIRRLLQRGMIGEEAKS